MTEKAIQGSCYSCKAKFGIPLSELKDDMTCPVCGEAASHLIGYSNTSEYEEAHKVQAAIRRNLGLPNET